MYILYVLYIRAIVSLATSKQSTPVSDLLASRPYPPGGGQVVPF